MGAYRECLLEVLAQGSVHLRIAGARYRPRKRITKGAHTPGVASISLRVHLRGQKSRPGDPEAPMTIGKQQRRVRLDPGLDRRIDLEGP